MAYLSDIEIAQNAKMQPITEIAKVAGAGTFVPITGFANAVVSPAIEAHSEGIVLGVGAKLFTIAGPVILFATLSSFVCGIVFYLVKIL